jgi:xylulokinase
VSSAALVLGLDVSTSATKALLMERDGTVVGMAAREYDFETPRPLWAEQDPALWWEAAQGVIAEVLASSGRTGDDVAAIGAAGQMHGMVLLDADGEVVRPAILWNDGRTAAECDAIRAAVGRVRRNPRTGNDPHPTNNPNNKLWGRPQEPEAGGRARPRHQPKD